jgi:signal-transduction protein with cAMP-binding, CBS, and nucleotidyltransferase domain
MSIGEFCTRTVVIAEKDTGIVELTQLMRKHHVGDVVVVEKHVDGMVPVGIITDRDIVVELIAEEVDLKSVSIGDVMSTELITAREKDGLWDTLQLMRSQGIRRLPVVNEKGFLEGILTVDDFIELLADELVILAKIADRGQTFEEENLE